VSFGFRKGPCAGFISIAVTIVHARCSRARLAAVFFLGNKGARKGKLLSARRALCRVMQPIGRW
jgi:hypothetical protein